MADRSGIEWTDASWQVTHGCQIVSPGCRRCYAMRLAARLERMGQVAYSGLTLPTPSGSVWNGTVREAAMPEVPVPLRWKRPRRIFVNSMSDLFHPDVGIDHIAHVFGIMACAQQHTFQVLTKRPERMAAVLGSQAFWREVWHDAGDYAHLVSDDAGYAAAASPRNDFILPNVWLGTSIEDQPRADLRLPHLRRVPAYVLWVSAEPLLGPVSLEGAADILDWVVVGGESGPGARPMHPDWARALRDQCTRARIPFFFKQWGEWREFNIGLQDVEIDADSEEAALLTAAAVSPGWITRDGRFFNRSDRLPEETPCRLMERIGKHRSGALLDLREHREFPA